MDPFTGTFTVNNMEFDIKTEHSDLPSSVPESSPISSNYCQASLKDGRPCSRVFCMSYNKQRIVRDFRTMQL